jgi:hypothetical protein
MSPRRPSSGGLRHARALAWFLNVPLSAFVVQSFRVARALYLDHEHPSPGQFTAALVSLVMWTSFLTLNLFAVLLRRRRDDGGGSAPGTP